MEDFDLQDTAWLAACAKECEKEERTRRSNESRGAGGQEGSTVGLSSVLPTGTSRSGERYEMRRASITMRSNYFSGVGIQPNEGLTPCGRPDPCWRCGEPTELLRRMGFKDRWVCTSRPFCQAVRFTSKNGVIVDLSLREVTMQAQMNKRTDTGTGSKESREGHYQGSGCFSRCALVVSIHSAPTHQTARRAFSRLQQQLLTSSTREDGELGLGYDLGLVATVGVEKRDLVKEVLKKEGIAFRDVPPNTYRHLAGSPSRSLEPIDSCIGATYMLPVGLHRALLPFQREGVLYALRRRGRCLIADEMGTGKTLQALGIMGCYRQDWPLLIVVPASMRLMWAEEVERWYPFLREDQVHLVQCSRDKLYREAETMATGPQVVIISYTMLRNLASGMGSWTL
ncbi:unnamed protein product [Discosporangium mesarthrocarpum]